MESFISFSRKFLPIFIFNFSIGRIKDWNNTCINYRARAGPLIPICKRRRKFTTGNRHSRFDILCLIGFVSLRRLKDSFSTLICQFEGILHNKLGAIEAIYDSTSKIIFCYIAIKKIICLSATTSCYNIYFTRFIFLRYSLRDL